MAHDREVAGIRCMEVLELLSDYVDGELERNQARRIEAHLRGCDWCEQFGGAFEEVVRSLRRELATPDPVPDQIFERLVRSLHNLDS